MQSNNANHFEPNQGTVKQESYAQAFYDPSSADGYVDMLSANSSLSARASTIASSNPQSFREPGPAPSPLSSPRTSVASPYSHHRTSSHGSDHVYSASMGQAFDSVDSLGRIGQISLDENSRYPSAFEEAANAPSNNVYSTPSGSGQMTSATAYGSLAATSSHSVNSSNSSIGSGIISASPQKNLGPAPQLTLGIPKVSVSDTSMDYTPVASVADSNMPSINVMAPSPSTPRAGEQHGHDGGFQDILAQLAAAQNNGVGMASIQENDSSQEPWLNDPSTDNQTYSRLANVPGSGQNPAFHSVTENPESWLQSPSGDAPVRPHSASGRIVPQSYNDEPSQLMSAFAGIQPRPNAPHGPGQWSSQAKRQDSYDKIRQFLRLDVDMGYQGSIKNESPTMAMFRKRANSDIGPRSPVSAGGGSGTAFDWSLPLAAQAQDGEKPANVSDWDMFRAKLESQFPDNQAFMNTLMANTGMANMQTFSQNTMDPSLLDGNHQPHIAAQDASFGSQEFNLQQPHQPQMPSSSSSSQQQQQQSEPSYADLSGTGGFAGQHGNAGEFNSQWRFPGDNFPPSASKSKLRRASSPRGSQGGHRRLAQSEDLSQSRLYQGPTEDFLARITAANGGLAPPATGRTVSTSNGAANQSSSSVTGSARVHPYRHDRHSSFSSNASTSSASSASPLPHARGLKRETSPAYYTKNVLPGYGQMGQSMGPSTTPSMPPEGDSPMMDAPAVPVVTSQATQAASASRRKAEALFACPVAGCGSTFTRQYNLRGHLRSHADERPYRCEWPGCDKSFARSHDCKRHQNLHLNIKPHTCELCGKTFARLDALNRHHKSDNSGCITGTDDSSSGQSNSAGSSVDSGSFSHHSAEANNKHLAETGDGMIRPAKGFGGHVL